MILLAACGPIIPADVPPQLEYTPGPFVVVTDQTYDAGVFTVRYPLGWQVVTPATFNTPWVVFIAPDDSALIVLALDIEDTLVTPANVSSDELQREIRQIDLDSETVIAVLVASPDEWDGYFPVFEAVLNSVRSNPDR